MKASTTALLVHRHQGFTLVELIIAIAIISVLVAIGLPSYREYVARTNRTVAKAALQELLTKQESYASDHKGYTANFSLLGYPGSGPTDTAYVTSDGVISTNSANALYQLALHASPSTPAMSANCTALSGSPSSGAPALAISAAPVVTGSDARCATLCISSRGERGASGTGGVADCWRR